MKYLLLFLASAIVYFFAVRQWKKNTLELMEKNKSEESSAKRYWNSFTFRLWPGYLFVLGTGLIVNNLIFK